MVVQQVMDGESLATCPAEDSTIHRWQASFQHAAPCIETLLRTDNHVKHPLFGKSLLAEAQKRIRRWLTFVTRLLIDSCVDVPTCFAFTPSG